MYTDNIWYGHRWILSKYCGLEDQKIFGSIQHGILTNLSFKSFKVKNFSFIPYYTWNKNYHHVLKQKNYKPIAIGSPFIYLTKIYTKILSKKRIKKGTLVFPRKSTYEIERKTDYKKLINLIENKFQPPYTVCIYHADLNSNLNIFKEKKWKIITLGKRSSKNFLVNFIKEVINYKKIICCQLSSHFFYLCYLNIKPHLVDKESYIQFPKKDMLQKNYLSYKKYLNSKYPGILNNQISKKKLKYIANKELGMENILTKKKLKKKIFTENFLLKLFINIFFILNSIHFFLRFGYFQERN